ncbi:polysaccharide biosynthesis/export family protein, partial [Prochlorococcus sp. AH-716-M06]|nr:polysaccharide biosynthesis/export family protein [Prochlorococcus sp. AH-716-M06]
DPYILGPGDIINLTILDSPEYSGKFRILQNGTLSLPLVGSVNILYKTTEDGELEIKKAFSKELLNPQVFLSIDETRPIRVSLIGEVTSPGIYILSKNNINQNKSANINFLQPTLVDALKNSGGITNSANLKKIILKRRLPGDKEIYKKTDINLLNLLREGAQSQNPYLFDGDIIVIPKAKINLNEFNNSDLNIANSNVSPSKIDVTFIGPLENPRSIELKPNTPLLQGILRAGGKKKLVSGGTAELIRINENGTISKTKHNLNFKKSISEKNNPILEDGDIVKVNYSIFGNVSEGLNVVSQPVSNIVNVWTLFRLLD